ncbi:MAG: LLM class flavin-dependent oxidoreductase [Myxococcota bacterium]
MRLSCALPPGPKAPELAAVAEELGYERLWFYDSPALYADIWVTIARTVERTQRIGVGTGVLIPSLRHVVTTAAAIGTIEALAPGRLQVAIGTGFTGRCLFGQQAMRWDEVRRYVVALRALLQGEEAEVDGKQCKLMHPEGLIAARPIEVPLIVAANGPRGLAIAKEIGDGVMCGGVFPEGVENAALLSFGTVLRPGEDFESPRVVEAIGPAIAVVYHGAYESGGAEAVDPLPGGAAWRAEVEKFPEASRHLYVHEGHIYELTDRDRRHIHPAVGASTFSGTAEDLRERAKAFESQGVGEIVYAPMGPDVPGELAAMKEALHG